MINKSWVYRLVKIFIKPQYREDIEGDLNEIFSTERKSSKGRVVKESFLLLRPELINNPYNQSHKLNFIMLNHYWKVALRGFLKNKITSMVSLVGLSLGLACALMGYLYINYFNPLKYYNSTDCDKI